LRAKLADGKNESSNESSSDDDTASAAKKDQEEIKESRRKLDDYDYSSGVESDNDVDLLVEQEVLHALKVKKEMQEKVDEELRKKGELPSIDEQYQIDKESARKNWEKTLAAMPDNYDFVIRTYCDGFPKGSQVFLCYGRMSNREMLKRYGFCLPYNKYNYLYIKLRLEPNDPEFAYRKYVLKKFFSLEDPNKSKKGSDTLDISSRHFRVYFQKLNTKVLKFIKILNFNVHDDDISCIVETRSLSLEYISL